MCAGPAAGTGGARTARGPALRGRTWWRRRRRGHGWAGEEEGTEPFPTPPFLRDDVPRACARRPVPSRAVPPSLPPPCPPVLSVAAPPAPVPVTPLRPRRVPAALPGSGARPLSRCPIPLPPPALAVPGALFQPPVPVSSPSSLLGVPVASGRLRGSLSTPELPPTPPSLPSTSAEPPPTTSPGTGRGRSCS